MTDPVIQFVRGDLRERHGYKPKYEFNVIVDGEMRGRFVPASGVAYRLVGLAGTAFIPAERGRREAIYAQNKDVFEARVRMALTHNVLPTQAEADAIRAAQEHALRDETQRQDDEAREETIQRHGKRLYDVLLELRDGVRKLPTFHKPNSMLPGMLKDADKIIAQVEDDLAKLEAVFAARNKEAA